MSAHRIELDFRSNNVTGRARIIALDPLQGDESSRPLTPECVTFVELRAQVDRLKAQLDRAVEHGAKEFGRLRSGRNG